MIEERCEVWDGVGVDSYCAPARLSDEVVSLGVVWLGRARLALRGGSGGSGGSDGCGGVGGEVGVGEQMAG